MRTQQEISGKQVPSAIFLEAFSEGAGSIRGTCCCGRTCYTSGDACYFDEGELEELERKAEKEPDKYIDFGDITVGFGYVDGKRFIYNCPCEMGSLYKYEAFIWGHRHQIIKFLVEVTKERKRRADEDHAGATSVEKAVEDAHKREENFGRRQERKAQLERINKLIENTQHRHWNIEEEHKGKEFDRCFEATIKEMREIQPELETKHES